MSDKILDNMKFRQVMKDNMLNSPWLFNYELGDAYGHMALGVEDIYSTCAVIKDRGGLIVREPGPMKHGNTLIAFVEDPDGYKIELIQRDSREDVI